MLSPAVFVVAIILGVNGLANAAMNPECFSGPGTTKSPMECCPIPKFIDDADFMACKSEYPPPSGPMGPPPSGPPPSGPPPSGAPPAGKGCCMAECIMNKTQVIVNGIFDKAAAMKVLTKSLDSTWKPIITNVINVCEGKAQAKKADFQAAMAAPAAPGEKVCNPMSGFLLDCFFAQMFLNCPADKFTVNDECNKIKSFVTKECPIMMLMKQM